MRESEKSSKGKRTRIIVVVLLAMVVAAAVVIVLFVGRRSGRHVAQQGQGGYTCPNCNVLLISVDTLRADHVGLYGSTDFKSPTPNMDGFFERGTVFERALASSPCTRPSILQFLSGVFDESPDHLRLAQILKDAGYQTAAFISQRLIGTAENPKPQYTAGFDLFDIQKAQQIDRNKLSTRNAGEVTDHALNWLEKNARKQKFFVWAHYFDPHDPYAPPEAFVSPDIRSSDVSDGDRRTRMKMAKEQAPDYPRRNRLNVAATDEVNNTWRFFGHIFNDDQVRVLRELHRSEIAYADAQIGRLFDALESHDLMENTIVILTADHGERLGEDDIWDHCISLHEREIHVPLLMRIGGARLRNHSRVARPVSTLDIVPTTLSLLGHDSKIKFDGQNLNTREERGPVFSMWENEATLVEHGLKLYYQRRNYRLATLQGASAENPVKLDRQNNTHVEMLKRLKAFLVAHRETIVRYEVHLQQLRALGYID